ncbi:MAG: sodium/solute symporter [Bacteroidia bacterium]|nr:sodium/solute symporter [Bacteroidia bacterium]
MIDLLIVIVYFGAIFYAAISARAGEEVTVEQYFLSSRNLRWPSIALSSIATNINGYQFLGMMGSAYLYGLAQASLEINAVQGILMAAFIFVPLFLREKVITVTQYIKKRLGRTVALAYSAANLLIFSTITLGAALFWGAYAADLVFAEYLSVISEDRITRISVMILGLGIFSAVYTYLGGLGAVVKTDIIQFSILLTGGFVVLFVSIYHLGGWGELYNKTPELMHLYLPADHEKLPWIHMFGLFLLNINYWCANQTIMQRSLAAKNLREAQIGLMVGGLMKYVMAVLIVVPGIALYGILGPEGLSEPDMAFPYLVKTYLPIGVKGLILCALFASLMSTVDSTFNSLATLWSIDIYKEYIRKDANDAQIVKAGKQTILVTLITGITMGLVLLYVKFENPEAAFTHTLNELRYYINCGIVVLICTAAFLAFPNHKVTLAAFFSTIPLHIILINVYPDMNYFVRAMWVILIAFAISVAGALFNGGFRDWKELIQYDSPEIAKVGLGLLLSLVSLHIIFA